MRLKGEDQKHQWVKEGRKVIYKGSNTQRVKEGNRDHYKLNHSHCIRILITKSLTAYSLIKGP